MELSRVENILKYFLGEEDTLPQPLSRVEALLIALGELISSGAVSSPIKIKGRVDTVYDLPSNAEPGWMYYVGPANANEFAEYVYLDTGEWQYTGTSNSAIDISLSTTSTNPVENRVITEAINLINQTLSNKVDKVAGKGLSTEDFTTEEKAKLFSIETGANANVQADWNQTDDTADDFIKNKPTIPEEVVVDQTYDSTSTNAMSGVAVAGAIDNKVDKVTGKGLSTEDYTTAEKEKLYNIESGAQINVQADWNQTDDTADDFIKNKPDITFVQVNADWNATSGVAQILNKPNIPSGVIVDLVYDPTSKNAQAGIAVASVVSDKVDKVNGKGLSTNDFTDADKDKLDSIASNAEVNVQSDWNQNDSTSDDFIKNKPTIAPANDAILEIQKNGIKIGEFTANASVNSIVNITVPVDADDVSALPDTTKYGAAISLSIDSSTYVVTVILIDQDGETLGTAQTIDLPLESVVVNGSYDDSARKIVLTLNNGNTIEFSVADLVSGLQTEITSVNKLDADLVDDSTSANKFVTAADKTTWNAKSDFSGSYDDLTDTPDFATVATTGSYNDLTDKPVIPPGAAVDQTYDPTSQNAQSGVAVAGAIVDKVDKVNGKGLSTNDFTDTYKDKLDSIETGAESNVQSDWNQNDSMTDDFIKNKPTFATVATSGSYTDLSNKPTIPTVNNATLEIQKNGVKVGEFTADASSDVTVNITVPVDADDVSALPDTTKYASSIDVSIDNTTYVMTVTLKDQDGNALGTAQVVDLPLETVVVGGSYDDTTQKVVLTLNNGNTVEFSVADLVAGLQSEITSVNKLDADLVDDSTSVNKFVTATEKSTWDAKSDFSGSYNDLADKPTIPAAVTVDQTYDSTSTNAMSGVAVAEAIADKVDKETGKGLSSNDFTSGEKSKLAGIETGAEANVQSDWEQTDDTADDYIKNKPVIPAAQVNADWDAVSGVSQILNKPTIPTVNNGVLTVQKNGTSVGTFSANAATGATINITVPVDADDVSALPDTTKYGSSLSLSINSTTYVVTASLKDQDGNTLGTVQTIDLPLETVVVGGSYDDTTKKVILTLKNGTTVDFSVADLVAGLQTEITSTNKLSADLIDDSNSTHKFITAAEKAKISNSHEWTYTEVRPVYDSTSQAVLLHHQAYDEENNAIVDDTFPFDLTFPVATTTQAGTMSAADKTKLDSALTSSSSLDPSNLSSAVSVSKGGTGSTTLTSNAILAGNGTSAVKKISTASGALYATSSGGAASFGTLPVAQGGTGATSASSARSNLGLGSAATYDVASSVSSGAYGLTTGALVYSAIASFITIDDVLGKGALVSDLDTSFTTGKWYTVSSATGQPFSGRLIGWTLPASAHDGSSGATSGARYVQICISNDATFKIAKRRYLGSSSGWEAWSIISAT